MSSQCSPSSPAGAGLYDPSTEHDACGVGFVASLRGEKSHGIVTEALEVLARLSHRAAAGCDAETGDGAGISMQIPHRFFQLEAARLGIPLPARRQQYGVGMVFLPADAAARRACEAVLEEAIAEEGQRLLGWRDVPVDATHTGRVARASMPVVRQVLVGRTRIVPSAFERTLFVIRKLAENRVRERALAPEGSFHVASLSSETLVYKGLLLPRQLPSFYPDLVDTELASAIAVVHSRFSTNTFPTWELAQPFRFLAHNGEINTVRGNRNWMTARRHLLESNKLGGKLDRLFPLIVPGKSDSAQFDNMLELLFHAGRSLPHALMMMIPEAWERDAQMDEDRRAFYEYASSLVEPWDGPAALAFTDGHVVGATLDRNGLRPARWLLTEDDRVVLASEAGVVDVDPRSVVRKGRLMPGRMFVVDTLEGRILEDEEVKREVVSRFPYRKWLRRNVFSFESLPERPPPPRASGEALARLLGAFGYTSEELRLLVEPMARSGKEPVGSMGTDTPLAVLSDEAPPLFSYFHQLFAQVTNPPIDPLREALVMTIDASIGPDGNSLEETPEQCHRISLPGAILTSDQLAKIAAMEDEGVFDPVVLSCVYPVAGGARALEEAVDALADRAAHLVGNDGKSLVILSDRGVDAEHAPVPSLLALSAVHQRLVRDGIRRHTGLVVESGDAREVHHFACLIGFGAAAVSPWLALDCVAATTRDEGGDDEAVAKAEARFVEAVNQGLLKVMSKMGISTIQSYRGAQIFEAVGLSRELVARHFSGTPSRLGGVGLAELGREVSMRHERGFGEHVEASQAPSVLATALPPGGFYQWRRRGERHKWQPATIAALQAAVREDDHEAFARYERLADDEVGGSVTLRGLLALASEASFAGPRAAPIALDEVEPASAIVARFVSGAMSFGSISAEAHETLAIGMNRIGARSNSGEGGEESRRYVPDERGDLRRSSIKQVASGRFGVTAEYLVNADELQIKMAQGAKPGEGGQLPGHKVDERIAKVRHSTPGVTLISPPPHHDIYSIEDLAELIYDLSSVSPEARISVKLVSEIGVGTVAAGVAKAGAGAITISGYEGGTGASPLSSIKYAGLPWELGLSEAHQVLVMNDLRSRVRLQADGGLRTGRDVVVAALLGADEFGLATASLVALGCVMLRKCHLNTCSVGIATQDDELRGLFRGEAEHVVRFFTFVAESVRRWLASLGARTLGELVGRVELLSRRADLDPTRDWKASTLDLGPLLATPSAPASHGRVSERVQRKDVSDHFDRALLDELGAALGDARPVRLARPVRNENRAVGAMLSGEIARRFGARGLPDETLHLQLTGSAGQSFGAFLAHGVTLELEGDANDYVGKGLSGGRVIVYPPRASRFRAEENVIVGNTVLYGATSGEVFFSGLAGERFAVRNSGATAVVEGVGDHGCEYMTGGVVVVLGPVGRNFAAGMSGGVAYVFDPTRAFRTKVNLDMVGLEPLDDGDQWLLRSLVERHAELTASAVATRLLDHFDIMLRAFTKVLPTDYKRVLEARRASKPPSGRRVPLARGSEPASALGGE
jgi:glutamate synthase (NADPH/NADH) large chain